MVEMASGSNRFQLIHRNLEDSLPSAELRSLLLCPRQPGVNSTYSCMGVHAVCRAHMVGLGFFVYLDVIFSMLG